MKSSWWSLCILLGLRCAQCFTAPTLKPLTRRLSPLASNDGDETVARPAKLLRLWRTDTKLFPAKTRLRKSAQVVSSVAINDGTVVAFIEEEGEFTRVRTRSGDEGLIRTTHLTVAEANAWDEEEWDKPWFLLALEEQSRRSRARRVQAVKEADGAEQLVSILRPLEALFGFGALVDGVEITPRGWAVVALGGAFPVYGALTISRAFTGLAEWPLPRQSSN